MEVRIALHTATNTVCFSSSTDRTNVVNLGFEDSTINADEVSYENHEAEENETNRYIELLK